MKSALVRPERIDKIEAILSNSLERDLHACKRMQRSCRGEKIGHRRSRRGDEASVRVMSREEPIAHGAVYRHRQVSQQSRRRSRRIRRTAAFRSGRSSMRRLRFREPSDIALSVEHPEARNQGPDRLQRPENTRKLSRARDPTEDCSRHRENETLRSSRRSLRIDFRSASRQQPERARGNRDGRSPKTLRRRSSAHKAGFFPKAARPEAPSARRSQRPCNRDHFCRCDR